MPVHDHTPTFGLAIGLGVGVPVFLTICVIIGVTIKHHYKTKREDEESKDLDFNGDISFYSPEQQKRVGAFNDNSHDSIPDDDAVPSSVLYTSDLHTPFNSESMTSKQSLSKEIYSVYGPSPAYASVERLRAPSTTASLYSYQSPSSPSSYRNVFNPHSPQQMRSTHSLYSNPLYRSGNQSTGTFSNGPSTPNRAASMTYSGTASSLGSAGLGHLGYPGAKSTSNMHSPQSSGEFGPQINGGGPFATPPRAGSSERLAARTSAQTSGNLDENDAEDLSLNEDIGSKLVDPASILNNDSDYESDTDHPQALAQADVQAHIRELDNPGSLESQGLYHRNTHHHESEYSESTSPTRTRSGRHNSQKKYPAHNKNNSDGFSFD